MIEKLDIRVMTPADLDRAVDWAAAEGWNPGLDDAPAFRATDPDGFLMGFVGGRPMTAISVVAYGAQFGFLGFYICAPEARGRGHGWATWQAGMARLGERLIGLDGVVAQQANYRKSGFALAHRNVRYGGVVQISTPADPQIQPVAGPSIEAVLAFDRAYFPAPRPTFLQAWLGPPRRALAFVTDGTVRGYGVIRACREGHKIGPLFAESPAIADALFRALAAGAKGPVSLDLPEPNADAIALATRYGLRPAFETARMYRGQAPSLPLKNIYGITTFELG